MSKSRNAGSDNPMFGKKHTGEALAKMKAAATGRKYPARPPEWRKHLSEAHKGLLVGEKNPAWNGGKKMDRGYFLLYRPTHPFANQQGYVYEHRLVMEFHLGRFLLPEERPHHINENRSDNRIENLKLYPDAGTHIIEAGHLLRHGGNGQFVKRGINPPPSAVTPERIRLAFELRSRGLGYKQVAKFIGLPKTTTRRIFANGPRPTSGGDLLDGKQYHELPEVTR